MKTEKLYKEDFYIVEKFLNNNFSSPTHWPHWNNVVSKHFNTTFFYYAVFENGELKGVLPCHQKREGILINQYSGQFHYIPYGGWLFSSDYLVDNIDLNKNLFTTMSVYSLPLVKEFSLMSNKTRKNYSTLVIDLKKDINEIWTKDIDSKRRNMIRKAEKNDVSVNILYNSCNELFFEFYDQFNLKNNLKSLSFSFFKEFNESLNLKVTYIEAYYKEELLSITVTVSDKDYSIYWLGLNKKGVPNLGQGELLQWEAIKFAKNNECRYYDLCYVEKERLPHIYEFKKGFSRWEVNVPLINNKSIYYKIINRINKCF